MLAVAVVAVVGLVRLFPWTEAGSAGEALDREGGDRSSPSKPVSFASEKREVVHTAMTFVKTAVTGLDMGGLVGSRRAGHEGGPHERPTGQPGRTSRSFTTPLSSGRWRLQHSYANEIDLQVALFEHLKQRRPEVFDVTLHPVRDGSRTRWLVSSFLPTPTQGGGAGGSYRSKLFEAPNPPTASLSARWLLAPLAVFALLPVLLLVLGVRRWRGARLYRAYARQDYNKKA